MPTLDSPADRAPRRRAAAAMAATCVLTVAVLMAACGGHDHDEATGGSGKRTGAVTASETGMAGPGGRADTDTAAPAAHSPGGTAASTVTTTATATETATAPVGGDRGHDDRQPPVVTGTYAEPADPGDPDSNAHVINTGSLMTFDPNRVPNLPDAADPAQVATSYLLARLGCDSRSAGLLACTRTAAGYAEPGFGQFLIGKVQGNQGWRRTVLGNHLEADIHVDDIAQRPVPNGWQVTIAYTRTVSTETIPKQVGTGTATMTVEPAGAGRWWVTADSSLGGNGQAAG